MLSQIITVDVVEESVEEHGKDGIRVPLLHDFVQEVLSTLRVDHWHDFFLKILLNKLLVKQKHTFVLVMHIALL